MPFLRVTTSPEELPEGHIFDGDEHQQRVEAVRFVDARYQSCYNLLHEISHELAQTQTRCEILERRLRKYEQVNEWEPLLLPDRDATERVSL